MSSMKLLLVRRDCIALYANEGWKEQSIRKVNQRIACPDMTHEIWCLKNRLKLTAPAKYHLHELL
jgi:hypothetical protein